MDNIRMATTGRSGYFYIRMGKILSNDGCNKKMTPQEQIIEAINDAKNKVAKKFGYKTWEDAYKLNGGNSLKVMMDAVMMEVYEYARGTKISRSDEKRLMVETMMKWGHDKESAEDYAYNKFDWDKSEELKAKFESKN